MVVTAADLKTAGITVPILVGGAALSGKFTENKIAPAYDGPVAYCKDAMTGLATMNRLGDLKPATGGTRSVVAAPEELPETTTRSSRVRIVPPLPAPYPDRKVIAVPNLTEVWSYINPQMLFVKHLGFKTNFERALAARDPKAMELAAAVEEVKSEAKKFMKVKAVWQYFAAESDGNRIRLSSVLSPQSSVQHTFQFLRQRKPDGLCLADYVVPATDSGLRTQDSGLARDSLAMFVVTAGAGIIERANEFKARGEFLKSHALQALALETAEAAAEWLHRRIREDWGFPDPATMTMLDRFQARYQGKRYSFGYPACPALEDQAGIFKLLRPEEIGVNLTEGFMMEPEASVSALVFHHPECAYFGVGDTVE
jgi:5-methyltetrahydrofolate--homocysteine methyltransferase